MSIYLIKRIDPPDYDEFEGFVVTAVSETDARALCAIEDLDGGAAVWKDTLISSCELVGASWGNARIIQASYNAG